MSLFTRLVSELVFPLQERLKHHDTLRVHREIEQSQFWPLEKLEVSQEGR
jgi:phenylacetate-CoA ligase